MIRLRKTRTALRAWLAAEIRYLNATDDSGPYREMWAAIVHVDNSEGLLSLQINDEFVPVVGRTRAEMDAWMPIIKPYTDSHPGEDISLRRYREYDFVEWIRKT